MCHPSNEGFVDANNFYTSIDNVTNITPINNYECIDKALVTPWSIGTGCYAFWTIPHITFNYNRNCENRAYLACYFLAKYGITAAKIWIFSPPGSRYNWGFHVAAIVKGTSENYVVDLAYDKWFQRFRSLVIKEHKWEEYWQKEFPPNSLICYSSAEVYRKDAWLSCAGLCVVQDDESAKKCIEIISNNW
ncbi:MAG: hypothetical protein LBK82_02810 [Planctomycetaceae bacterium]|jgi:hypothetical protein|nr:hypothetical protein [Planctomycetaceae bacterium]